MVCLEFYKGKTREDVITENPCKSRRKDVDKTLCRVLHQISVGCFYVQDSRYGLNSVLETLIRDPGRKFYMYNPLILH